MFHKYAFLTNRRDFEILINFDFLPYVPLKLRWCGVQLNVYTRSSLDIKIQFLFLQVSCTDEILSLQQKYN